MKKNLQFLFIIFSLLTSNLAFASANQDQQNDKSVKEVEEFVNGFGNQIIKITSNKKNSSSKKRDQMINLVDSLIDAEWITKFVLGKSYKTIDEAKKEQFRKLYRSFMINTYGPKFEKYNGKKFEIKNISDQNNYYLAKCLFYPDSSDPIVNIGFRVKKHANSNQYFVIDVIAEGVSLIETHRSEFNATIVTKGVDQFMNDLESRVKKLKAENSKPDDSPGN